MIRTVLICALCMFMACLPAWRRREPVYISSLSSREDTVKLRHYPGSGGRVLLVGPPGLSARIFDVPGFGGLAPYLRHEGHDVWVLDWSSLAINGRPENLAAAAHAVITQLSTEQPLSVFAYSLGGIPIVSAGAFLNVQRFVFLAVPGHLQLPMNPVQGFGTHPLQGSHSLAEGTGLTVKTGSPRSLYADTLWSYGSDPVRPETIAELFVPVGPQLLHAWQGAIREGSWGTAFENKLANLTQPAHVFSGQADAVAPPWQVHALFQKLGSKDKQYRFFSRANGESREFGHISLLVGADAAREVYPLLAEALE